MLTAFFKVSDSVIKLLASCHVSVLVDVCANLMASDTCDITLFSEMQIKMLAKCDSSLLLLQRLHLFYTWSNHSVLRVLADQCNEAVNILDNFDCRVYTFEPIASYPIPSFSTSMIPTHTSTHTILAIRCNQALYECTLQSVYNMQSILMKKCDITQHCLQLLAVRSEPTILYWTIPKCVVELINNNVPLYRDYLYSEGILEVSVYPDIHSIVCDGENVGLLAFHAGYKLANKKVAFYINYMYIY